MEQSKIIIIAGQDIQLIDFLTIEISKDYHKVYTAPDGEVCFKLAKTIHPNLIIMDTFMPRQSGLETLRALKSEKETKDAEIAVFTAGGNQKDIENLGAVALHKDVTPETIISDIKKLFI
ncbi:MAG: response regulator [Patescibacteria group bacterium]|nr:response regulator [Patescibacteria group bacterium]